MWRRLVYWQGTFGYPRLLISNYSAQPASTPGTLDNTVAAMSNAGIVQISEGVMTPFSPAPLSAIYPSVTQTAIVTCLDAVGFAFKLTIPAPRLAIFAADAVTVSTASLASLLTAALLDGLVSPYNNAIASMPSGILNGPAEPGSSLN
jgi:hypothetical protein